MEGPDQPPGWEDPATARETYLREERQRQARAWLRNPAESSLREREPTITEHVLEQIQEADLGDPASSWSVKIVSLAVLLADYERHLDALREARPLGYLPGEDGPVEQWIEEYRAYERRSDHFARPLGSDNVLLPLVSSEMMGDGTIRDRFAWNGEKVEATLETADRVFGESSPRHPDPRCKECGERLGESDRAEVYIDPMTLRANAGGQDVLVDDIPEEAFGPYIVHADPCSQAARGGRKLYSLA